MKYIFLALIIFLAVFVRVYQTTSHVGFWFDQGRDALVVNQMLHGKFVLIGPTTGIEGIFLGPGYYYLLAPFYFLGHSDPSYAAVGIAMCQIVALILMGCLVHVYISSRAAIFTLILYGLSYKFMLASRWLSNPTPLPLTAIICLWCLYKISLQRATPKIGLILGFSLGLSLHFEAASAIFFVIPAILILIKRPRYILFTTATFLVTLLPQLFFNFRHDNILFFAFKKFLVDQNSFNSGSISLLSRLNFYYSSFTEKFFPTQFWQAALLISVIVGFILAKKIPLFIRLCLLWLISPLVALLFYHGNNGFVWDYYFTGIYPALVMIVAWSWSKLPKIFSVSLITIFLYFNFFSLRSYLSSPQPPYITLKNVVNAVDYVYLKNSDSDFNLDIYVPPVVASAYDYVIQWRGQQIFHHLPASQPVPDLYLLLESDTQHPYFRQKWLNRQYSYGSVISAQKVGPLSAIHIRRYAK